MSAAGEQTDAKFDEAATWELARPFLVKTTIERARGGSDAALRLAMERSCPVKERAKVELPKIYLVHWPRLSRPPLMAGLR
jgi:hypothetical protein